MLRFISNYICSKNKDRPLKIIDTNMTDTFNFISDDDEPKEYKVLVLGEAGVGKTTFIRALKENIAIQKTSFSESEYIPTKTEFTEYIPETSTSSMIFDSVVENTINKKYSKEVANFMIRAHLDKEEQFFLMEKKYMGQCNYLKKCNFGEIEIVEMPSTTRSFPLNFHYQFDKIIIMGNYHDITTLRSIQYWAELVKTPASKLIVCVNKCDVSPNDLVNDFQSRKAKVLRHFFDKCELEFISVKTGANLTFLYKHL